MKVTSLFLLFIGASSAENTPDSNNGLRGSASDDQFQYYIKVKEASGVKATCFADGKTCFSGNGFECCSRRCERVPGASFGRRACVSAASNVESDHLLDVSTNQVVRGSASDVQFQDYIKVKEASGEKATCFEDGWTCYSGNGFECCSGRCERVPGATFGRRACASAASNMESDQLLDVSTNQDVLSFKSSQELGPSDLSQEFVEEKAEGACLRNNAPCVNSLHCCSGICFRENGSAPKCIDGGDDDDWWKYPFDDDNALAQDSVA